MWLCTWTFLRGDAISCSQSSTAAAADIFFTFLYCWCKSSSENLAPCYSSSQVRAGRIWEIAQVTILKLRALALVEKSCRNSLTLFFTGLIPIKPFFFFPPKVHILQGPNLIALLVGFLYSMQSPFLCDMSIDDLDLFVVQVISTLNLFVLSSRRISCKQCNPGRLIDRKKIREHAQFQFWF